ncbi:MAG: succinyl-diaminopimelate desuccinylase [Xanthomonadales bacterium]|nr:succinyl-diaminopimelate desuccinylase [Xanthomonadales bacterium]
MSPVIDLTCELVARKSLTPDDAGCQALIAARLAEAGFTAEWMNHGEVTNVLLTRGQGSPSFWFLGHTDVVPTGPVEEWTSPPFEPEIRDGVLYGRGVADMKGGVAAMVCALECFAGEHPDHAGQIGLLLTSDEEGIAENGVRRVAQDLRERGIAPDHCLVGEPSSQEVFGDTVRVGRRGSISAKLIVRGVQGHTAFPHKVDNPVHRLAPFLAELVAERWDEGDDDFPPTHCQVSNINAGTGAENVTPGTAELMFNFRNGPASPGADLKSRIEAMLERHDIENFQLQWRVSGEPFRSEPGPLRAAVRAAVKAETGAEPDMNTGGGTSDGRFIAPLGSEVLELGVVSRSIHQLNEHAALADIEALERCYRAILERLPG